VSVVALKAWKMAEEVNMDRGSDVSKVLEVKNTCAKFEQFFWQPRNEEIIVTVDKSLVLQ
jgi:hypothetical protein